MEVQFNLKKKSMTLKCLGFNKASAGLRKTYYRVPLDQKI